MNRCPKCGWGLRSGGPCPLCAGDLRSPCCRASVVVLERNVFSCYGCGAVLIELAARKLGERELPPRFSGTCTGCGCTDDRACANGCSWADREQTVCTECTE